MAGVIQAILQGVQYIASLEKFSFLSTKLPLLNKSVSDLIGAADQLLQKVNAAANAVAGGYAADVWRRAEFGAGTAGQFDQSDDRR